MLNFLFPNHDNFPPTDFGTILSALLLSDWLEFCKPAIWGHLLVSDAVSNKHIVA